MRVETLREIPINTLTGSFAPQYPPKGERFISAAKGFYKKHGPEFHFSPYIDGTDGLVNPDGSSIRRDVSREKSTIESYLQRQDALYLSTISQLSNTLPPMHDLCRIAVPIIAHNEQRAIYHTLTEWAAQEDLEGNPLDPNTFELNINVNGPDNYERDNTIEEIEKFRSKYPQIKTNVIDVEFASSKGNAGMARKLITDITAQRSMLRDRQMMSCYIQTGDSDIFFIPPNTLAKRSKQLDDKPDIDAIVGTNDYQPELLMHHDLVFFQVRSILMWNRLVQVRRLRPDQGNTMFDFHNIVPTNGCNTAFSLEAYALAGGYPPSIMQEDYDLGMRFGIMRGFNEQWEGNFNSQTVIPSPQRMQTSPRRTIFAFAEEEKLPYKAFSDAENIRAVRGIDPEKVLANLPHARITENNAHVFEKELQVRYIDTQKTIHDPHDRELIFNQLLVFLGFRESDVIIEEGKIKIKNINNIKKALDKYRERNAR